MVRRAVWMIAFSAILLAAVTLILDGGIEQFLKICLGYGFAWVLNIPWILLLASGFSRGNASVPRRRLLVFRPTSYVKRLAHPTNGRPQAIVPPAYRLVCEEGDRGPSLRSL